MGNQSIHECAILISSTWMHHEACNLVDNNEVFVFKHNIQINGFALRLGLRGQRD
jgi:hypothetical protein